MSEDKLQKLTGSFRAFVQSNGWLIVSEKAITHGYQIEITDESTKTPVTLYTTGKILVQGKPGPLHTALKAWADGQGSNTRTLLQETDASLPSTLSTTPGATGIARIGSDESGKGDYFGPLVIAAVYVDKHTENQLLALKVRDSKLLTDSQILTLATNIKAICRGQGTIIAYTPQRYNALYQKIPNLNLLLAQAHAQAIMAVQKKVAANLAIVDQFADESLVRTALARLGSTLTIEQRPRAESDIAVAAASILARAEFVQQFQELSLSLGITLPKGASNPNIVSVGRAIVAQGGRSALEKVAKLHFKTTDSILS